MQLEETIKIQSCGSKILNFLVTDILDFSQMKSGKFRKNNVNFNVYDKINEVVTIE